MNNAMKIKCLKMGILFLLVPFFSNAQSQSLPPEYFYWNTFSDPFQLARGGYHANMNDVIETFGIPQETSISLEEMDSRYKAIHKLSYEGMDFFSCCNRIYSIEIHQPGIPITFLRIEVGQSIWELENAIQEYQEYGFYMIPIQGEDTTEYHIGSLGFVLILYTDTQGRIIKIRWYNDIIDIL